MRILAFETSAKAVSVALLTDGLLTGEYFQNSGQTHSRTLMKLAQDLLQNCDLTPSDVDAVAWANGPGSFTGVRIGAAAAKGFCWGGELPALAVSTLESMAWHLGGQAGIVCCCMDARRSQVYNALFHWEQGFSPVILSAELSGGQRDFITSCASYAGGNGILCLRSESKDLKADGRLPSLQDELTRLCDDRAIAVCELAEDLRRFDEPITLVGDGAALVFDALHGEFPNMTLAPEHLRQQRAGGVALAAWQQIRSGVPQRSAGEVNPNYLRLSQAERERLEKTTGGN